MNGNSILLDTNIILYLLSGNKELSSLLFNKKLYVSFVTQLELLGYPGISTSEQQEIRNFLQDCIIVDINSTIKELVIDIKRSRKMKLPDSIIIATAMYLEIPVISSDIDFQKAGNADVIFYEMQ